jgi:lysine-specific demethylase/histidyl-hydroxylase NO66
MTNHTPGGTEDRPALARAIAVDPAKFAEAYWGRR